VCGQQLRQGTCSTAASAAPVSPDAWFRTFQAKSVALVKAQVLATMGNAPQANPPCADAASASSTRHTGAVWHGLRSAGIFGDMRASV